MKNDLEYIVCLFILEASIKPLGELANDRIALGVYCRSETNRRKNSK